MLTPKQYSKLCFFTNEEGKKYIFSECMFSDFSEGIMGVS